MPISIGILTGQRRQARTERVKLLRQCTFSLVFLFSIKNYALTRSKNQIIIIIASISYFIALPLCRKRKLTINNNDQLHRKSITSLTYNTSDSQCNQPRSSVKAMHQKYAYHWHRLFSYV